MHKPSESDQRNGMTLPELTSSPARGQEEIQPFFFQAWSDPHYRLVPPMHKAIQELEEAFHEEEGPYSQSLRDC